MQLSTQAEQVAFGEFLRSCWVFRTSLSLEILESSFIVHLYAPTCAILHSKVIVRFSSSCIMSCSQVMRSIDKFLVDTSIAFMKSYSSC